MDQITQWITQLKRWLETDQEWLMTDVSILVLQMHQFEDRQHHPVFRVRLVSPTCQYFILISLPSEYMFLIQERHDFHSADDVLADTRMEETMQGTTVMDGHADEATWLTFLGSIASFEHHLKVPR